ncbi:MAG TPA: delta-60 repeat domain-containing protein [Kofleriaceae bacterium]|nr:delta-60 repeat domain-containing protein [Kofleriaceae bacterium]
MRGISWLPVVAAAALACGSVKKGDGADGGNDGGDFAVSLAPPSALVRQGASVDLEVTIDRQGVAGDIALTAAGLPDGVTAGALTIPDGQDAGTLTLEAAGDATQGEAAVTVTGEAPGGTGSGDLRLLVAGEPGSHDLSFADAGKLFGTLGFDLFAQRGITLQPDGKIVGTGSTGDQAITYRLNADGTLDDGFGAGGRVTTGLGESTGGLVPLVLADGRIVVAGWGGPLDPGYDSALFGYTADGELDGDFGASGTVTISLGAGFDEFHAFVEDPAGGLLPAGIEFTGGTSSLRRYDGQGNVDDAYVVEPAATAGVEAGILDSDGKTVLTGRSGGDFWMERHLASGELDDGFDSDGAVTTDMGGADLGMGVAEVAGGKLVVAGLSEGRVAIARYNRNGSLDLTFGDGGKVVTGIALDARGLNALAVDSQGRFLLVGFVAGPPRLPAVVRLTAEGQPDDSFGDGGLVALDFGVETPGNATSAFGIVVDADDRVIVACNVGPPEQAGIARLWP